MALDVNPGTTNYNLLPPIVPNATASPVTPPQFDEGSGAMSGLSGQAPTVSGPAPPGVEGPVKTHESVARHVLDALGGANPADKMGWAKSILAGGLSAAAN